MVEKSKGVILCDEDSPMLGESLLLADGFEDAFIGVAQRFGWDEPVALYDYERCIRTLVTRDGMDREGAEEFFQFNVIGAWVGEQTPIYVTGMTLDAVHASLDEDLICP
jgi:hypothetical protein